MKVSTYAVNSPITFSLTEIGDHADLYRKLAAIMDVFEVGFGHVTVQPLGYILSISSGEPVFLRTEQHPYSMEYTRTAMMVRCNDPALNGHLYRIDGTLPCIVLVTVHQDNLYPLWKARATALLAYLPSYSMSEQLNVHQ